MDVFSVFLPQDEMVFCSADKLLTLISPPPPLHHLPSLLPHVLVACCPTLRKVSSDPFSIYSVMIITGLPAKKEVRTDLTQRKTKYSYMSFFSGRAD